MYDLSCRDCRLASAFGALMFASLAFIAALYPLIQA
jgi:hypothetical protein